MSGRRIHTESLAVLCHSEKIYAEDRKHGIDEEEEEENVGKLGDALDESLENHTDLLDLYRNYKLGIGDWGLGIGVSGV